MRNPVKPFLFLICLFCAAYLNARILETVSQFESRYGKPKREMPSPDGEYQYKYYFKNGYNIMAVFYDGKAIIVNYTRPDEKNPFFQRYSKEGWVDTITNRNKLVDMNREMTPEEIEILKQANTAGEEWGQVKKGKEWKTTGGKVRCFYRNKILTFGYAGFEKKKTHNLRGF